MLRAVQDSFYTHIIPYLLWDDVLHFCNTNRASLALVSKRANMCVKHWTFPQTYFNGVLDRCFPYINNAVYDWQRRCAGLILTRMILHAPRKWIIRRSRRCGKTFFAMSILNTVGKCVSSQYISPSKRIREIVRRKLGNVSTGNVPLSYHAFQVIILDDADHHKEDYNYDKFLHRVFILTSDLVGHRRNTQNDIPNCMEIQISLL